MNGVNIKVVINILITLIFSLSTPYVLTADGEAGCTTNQEGSISDVRGKKRVKVEGEIDVITPEPGNPEEGELVVEGETFVVTSRTKFRGPIKSFSALSVGLEITAKGRRRNDGKVKTKVVKTTDIVDEEGKPTELLHPELYSDTSPFNQKIPPDAEIDPKSTKMVKSLIREERRQGFFIAVKKWVPPVYYVEEDTPRYDVKLTARWAEARVMKDVPIPDFATPDPTNDAEMVIIDLATGCEYDFWRARKDGDGKWSASWANVIPIDSDGIFPKGLSARGAGFALLAGMIWPDELEKGEINHALEFSYSRPKDGGPVPPATESDGTSKRRNAIPEGARIQLNPDLDLDALDLTPYEKTVAKALQEYGMFLGDAGGGIELEAINPISVQGDPYEGLFGDQDGKKYVYLNNIPVNEFRVLKLGPQDPDPDIELVPNGCAEFVLK